MHSAFSLDEAQVFRYENPGHGDPTKVHVDLCETDIINGSVQILGAEGANNLHSHKDEDGLWFVLSGTARFYTAGDEVVGEFGTHEGVLIPRGFPYWFEAVGDEELELLRVGSIDQDAADGGRVDVEADEREGSSTHVDGQVRTVTDPRRR